MPTIHPSTKDWSLHNTPEKRKNDEIIHDIIISEYNRGRKKELSVLSFPGDRFEFEKALAAKVKTQRLTINFEGIEEYTEIFNKAVKQATAADLRHHNWNLVNGRAMDYLISTNKKFNVIYLDWMGTWEKNKRDQITCIFLRKLFKQYLDNFLILTVGLNQGKSSEINDLDNYIDKNHIKYPFEEHYNGEITQNFLRKTYGLANKVAGIGIDQGYSVLLDKFNMYKSNGINHQNWEMSFVFRVS